MFGLLMGYKTYGLVALSFAAQAFSYFKPEYAPVCDKVSEYAMMGTPVTIRMAVKTIAGK